jgi:6-phosphogluconolactonase/Glucosamine-6-phosphate isomerase/deaminase
MTEGGWPVFDLILLGVGADGHLLSVFPGSAAFESQELAMAIPAPTHIDPHVERVTLNPAVIGVARGVLVVVGGAAKAAVLAEILGDLHDPSRLPGQLARREGATWIVDAAAAASLRR